MFKKMSRSLLVTAAAICTLAATFVASSACFWGWYQPEEPKSLREE